MTNASKNRFPWIPLIAWVFLFLLVVVSAMFQKGAPVELRLGMVAFWGVALTGFLTIWLSVRRARQDLPIDHVPPPPPADLPADPAHPVAKSNWIHALEQGAWCELLQSMTEETDVDRFFRVVAPHMQQLFPGSAIGVYLRDLQDTMVLHLKMGEAFVGAPALHMSECEALSHGNLVLRDIASTEHVACAHHGPVEAVRSHCLPLSIGDRCHGLLVLYHPLSAFSEHKELEQTLKQKVQTFGAALSLFLQGLDLKDNLSKQLIRDPWTGLFNRRYMEETLYREFAEATRRHTTIGVVMFRPDQVKSVRETHGPKAADQLLWEVAQRIPRYIRTEDIPCRFEEDTFCVILPGAAREITEQRAERIRNELGGLSIIFQNQSLSTTMSVGVTMYPEHSPTVHGLVAMAEMAVRHAQRQGGNCVAQPPQTVTINWESEP